jgi:hypothetical protein
MRAQRLGWIFMLAFAIAGNIPALANPAPHDNTTPNIDIAEKSLEFWQPSSLLSSPDLLSSSQFELAENCTVDSTGKIRRPSQRSPRASDCPVDPTKVGGAEDRPIQSASSQRLLYNEFNFSGLFDESSFSNYGGSGQFIYAFLPEQGEIFSEVAYDYTTFSYRQVIISGRAKPARVQKNAHNITPLLEYALTDDLSVGAEMTWSSAERTVARGGAESSVAQDQWHNPTFLANYRLIDQSDEPVTAFLRAYYRPAVFEDTRNLWGMGGTLIRNEDWFAVSASFDANYMAQFRPNGVWDGSWRYRMALELAAAMSDRWSIAIGTGYSFAFEQDRHGTSFDTLGHGSGAAWVSGDISYILVPDHLTAALLAGHEFSSSTGLDTIGDEMHPGLSGLSVTRSSGANIVGLTLTASVSAGDVW